MGQLILTILASGTFRRFLFMLVGLGVSALNRKFGLDLSEAEVLGILTAVLGYVLASNGKEATVKKAIAAVPDGDRDAAAAAIRAAR